MSYLFDYLELLTAGERTVVCGLELAPRERQVLCALLDACGGPEPSREELTERLGMSGSHFDKVASLLLRRVYNAVVPEGGIALLYDLNRRALYPAFAHEYRRQQREIAGSDSDTRAEFYLAAANLLSRVTRDNYNEKLMMEAARAYDRLRPSPDNAVYFEAHAIGGAIWNAAARGTNRAMKSRVAARLERNRQRITADTGPAALFKHYHACALYYGQMDEQPAERLRYLEMADALTRLHPDTFTREEIALLRCRIAESHYFNSREFRHAARLYDAAFREYPEVLARDYYHTTKFIQLSIICGRHTRAERLLRKRFGLHLSSEHASIGTMGAISWAKLLLACDRVGEAKPYLDFGFAHNRKNFFVQYEIELRILEALYFSMLGDDEFVEQLVAKNLKYLRSKGFSLATSRYYPWLFKLLAAFIAERRDSRPLSPALAAKLAEFDEGPAALYGTLLKRARTRR